MITLDPIWTVRIAAWGIRLWRFLGDNLTRSSPQRIRLTVHNEALDSGLTAMIAKVTKDIQDTPTNTSKADRRQAHPELRRKGDLYWYLAELYWGKPSDRHRFTSAWFYVLAAKCYEPLDEGTSGQLFHWAAHEFRGLHSYERSIEFYQKAGDLLKVSHGELSARSFTRAVSVARLIGDESRASDILAKAARQAASNKPDPGDG